MTYWIIKNKNTSFVGEIRYLSKYHKRANALWTKKSNEIEKFKSYQAAYALLSKLEIEGVVEKVEK